MVLKNPNIHWKDNPLRFLLIAARRSETNAFLWTLKLLYEKISGELRDKPSSDNADGDEFDVEDDHSNAGVEYKPANDDEKNDPMYAHYPGSDSLKKLLNLIPKLVSASTQLILKRRMIQLFQKHYVEDERKNGGNQCKFNHST